ncbi:hypothetical protein V8G54_009593, partial [Vigna mungo]
EIRLSKPFGWLGDPSFSVTNKLIVSQINTSSFSMTSLARHTICIITKVCSKFIRSVLLYRPTVFNLPFTRLVFLSPTGRVSSISSMLHLHENLLLTSRVFRVHRHPCFIKNDIPTND